MTVKFATVMGNNSLATKPFYFGIPQHERTMTIFDAGAKPYPARLAPWR